MSPYDCIIYICWFLVTVFNRVEISSSSRGRVWFAESATDAGSSQNCTAGTRETWGLSFRQNNKNILNTIWLQLETWTWFNYEIVPLSDEGITDVDTYHSCLHTLHIQAVVEAKMNFVPNRVLAASPPDISLLEKSAASVSPYHTCPVAFWSLSALEHLQGPHHQRHIRCLSGDHTP